ncbi:MAG: archease [Pseudomonadota bacterium]
MRQKKKTTAPCSLTGGGYEEIPHTADLALRVWGKDLHDLFVNAAAGMTTLMSDASVDGSPTLTRALSIEAMDAESLLVEWLSELAYLAESEGALFESFSIANITETGLNAVLENQLSGKPTRTIKAVTYHGLNIVETKQGFEATVVFDV